jgi:iron complex transport system substrate-binding protein
VAAVAAGRVYQWLGLPYGWGARPPSVNRLPGLMWLAYVLPGRAFDAPFYDQVRGFFNDFYHVELGDPSLRKLVQE